MENFAFQSRLEIQFTFCWVQSFRMYSTIVCSMFTEIISHPTLSLKYFLTSRTNIEPLSYCSDFLCLLLAPSNCPSTSCLWVSMFRLPHGLWHIVSWLWWLFDLAVFFTFWGYHNTSLLVWQSLICFWDLITFCFCVPLLVEAVFYWLVWELPLWTLGCEHLCGHVLSFIICKLEGGVATLCS